MLGRIAPILVRRRKAVIGLWALFFVTSLAFGSGVVDKLETDAEGKHGTEAGRVLDELEALGQNQPDVVGLLDGASPADPATAATLGTLAAELRAIPGVTSVVSGLDTPLFVSTDGQASLVGVRLDPTLAEREHDDAVDAVRNALRAAPADDVIIGGTAILEEETIVQNEKDLRKAELISLPIVLLLAVLIFGGFTAASLPLIIGLVAVPGSLLVLNGLSAFTSLHLFALNAATMLGLGLAVDYALLIVSRFREERGAGHDVATAVENTVRTAGVTVAFSGLTVGVALLGFVVFDNDVFRSIGYGAIGVVVLAMVAAVTLLPAVLATIGHRIAPAQLDKVNHGYFHRVATVVQRRAGLIATTVTVFLLILAVPFMSARIEIPGAESLPRSLETRQLFDEQQERFLIGGDDPITIVVDAPVSDSSDYLASIRAIDGVEGAQVRGGITASQVQGDPTIIDALITADAQSAQAERIVREIRALDAPADAMVGGPAAMLIDQRSALYDRLPWSLAVMGLATFILLFLLTGSMFIPLKAILMNLLSLTATFGVLVWGFQEGHLAGVLGFDAVGFLALWLPFLVFFLAFGLSMDYEVFLLARIKEEYERTGDNDVAVSSGLQRTGRIITSAAVLIGVVFAAFATGASLDIKAMGVGLTLAILIDATIVRTLLVPATMKLMGHWNWWAPAPLRRLHERFGLHKPATAPPPVAPEVGGVQPATRQPVSV
ncbi:MAG TPA: MMPL family transporter [Acidimicrobiales bacterium]|nr:MMPL family transporter [Acidimicrobiales bacterium]